MNSGMNIEGIAFCEFATSKKSVSRFKCATRVNTVSK